MRSADNTDNIVGWHVNNGKDNAASFYPANALYAVLKRPDVVKKILVTLNEDEAIRLANSEKGEGFVPLNVAEELAKFKNRYEVKLEPSGLGKAIIIAAGGEPDRNTLFPYSNDATTDMYRFLHRVGFSDGDIIYMNPYPPVVPFNGYVDTARQDFPMRDPKIELHDAFAQASQDLKADQQFILYLHGHARTDYVRISQTAETSAQEIKTLLDQIPADVEQIIILDTCYSGSFLDDLSGVPNRILITSADAESLAWSPEDVGGFSYTFIRELKSGQSVGDAFNYAKSKIIDDPKIFGKQNPLLDDTQDGFSASDDGRFSRRTYIGGRKIHGSLPPEITDMHPTIQLANGQTTATLWVVIPEWHKKSAGNIGQRT